MVITPAGSMVADDILTAQVNGSVPRSIKVNHSVCKTHPAKDAAHSFN